MAGGSDDVIINFTGNAAGLQGAAEQASKAMLDVGVSAREGMQQASAATADYSKFLVDMIGQMQMMREQMVLTADATSLLGAGTARAGLEWLQASENADQYQLRLQLLREQIQMTQAQQNMSGGGGGSWFGGLNFGGGIGGLLSSALPEEMTAAFGPIGMIFGLIANNPLTGFIGQLGQTADGILQVAIGMGAWTIFMDAAQWVQQAVDQMFQLNNTMERFQQSWQFQFTPAGQDPHVQGVQIAKQLSTWSLQESYNLPFTRQDMLSAITALSKAGVSAGGIEQYMPYIADIAATSVTMTGDPVTLTKAAYAIQGATHGMSRMLRYDLGIDPGELAKYGYTDQQPWMLLPALKQWAIDHNRSSADSADAGGAAYQFAHTTFWGEYSSFIDRLQNLGLEGGGYDNTTGSESKTGLFGTIKTDLESLSSWMDAHWATLQKIGTLFGQTLADSVNAITNAFKGLFDAFSSAGVPGGAMDLLQRLDNWLAWLSDPSVLVSTTPGSGTPDASTPTRHQRGGAGGNTTDTGPTGTLVSPMQQLGDIIGQGVLNAVQALGNAWQKLVAIVQPSIPIWQQAGAQFQLLMASISPQEWAAIRTIAGGVLGLLASGFMGLATLALLAATSLTIFQTAIKGVGTVLDWLWDKFKAGIDLLDRMIKKIQGAGAVLGPLAHLLNPGGGGGSASGGGGGSGSGSAPQTHAAVTGLATRAPGGARYAFGRFG